MLTSAHKKLDEIIKNQVNPSLKLHSGSAELIDYNDGVARLKLFGGCSGCPSSAMALFGSVVSIIKNHMPEVEDVILA